MQGGKWAHLLEVGMERSRRCSVAKPHSSVQSAHACFNDAVLLLRKKASRCTPMSAFAKAWNLGANAHKWPKMAMSMYESKKAN
eukprot:evm.model.NODE_31587_length_5093_cov_29.021599.1